nr:MAG TPA: tail protein [Caudoviricetes sp.]
MIKYEDAELISVLPPVLSSEPDNVAISYAYKMAMEKIIRLSIQTSLYADIDNMDENILDLMALEFRTQYYDEGLPIDIKRQLVKNALGWYQRAGTPNAVKELINIVFGEGDIVEWFDFADPPYTPGTFEIQTESRVTEELILYFTNLIHRVKNARSHIRRITILRNIGNKEYGGAGAVSKPERNIYGHKSRDEPAGNKHYVGTAVISMPEINILSQSVSKGYDIGNKEYGGAGAVSEREITYNL